MYKLPVWQTVKDAYSFTFDQWRWVLKYATPLIVLSALFTLVGIYFAAGGLALPEASFALLPIGVVIGLALSVTFAVAMHRHYLLGPDPRGARAALSWKRRHWRFLGGAILVGLAMALLTTLFSLPFFGLLAFDLPGIVEATFDNVLLAELIASVIGLVIWSLAFVVVCSALLKFPMRAIEAPAESFENTDKIIQGNMRRMTGVFILGDFIPFTVFDYIVSALWRASAGTQAIDLSAASPSISMAEPILTAVYFLGWLFWLAVTAVMLSMVYKQLSENVTLPAKPAPPNADD